MSDNCRNLMVEVVASLIDAAPGAGRIELMSRDNQILATLRFSKPSAGDAENGRLNFAAIHEDPHALISGQAVVARILDGSGKEVFKCDVSDDRGDGVIKLNTDLIVRGGPVRIRSFSLTMPA